MNRELELIGKLAWRAYMTSILPTLGLHTDAMAFREWLDVPENERAAWCAAASAVAQEMKRRTQDVFFGVVTI